MELSRGGHDPLKVYVAFKATTEHKGRPTVILSKTVKGYGMGEAGEGQMITHQQKKMGEQALKEFRDRFQIGGTDQELKEIPFLRFADGSEEMTYLKARREALGGYLTRATMQIRNVGGAAAVRVQCAAQGHRRPGFPPRWLSCVSSIRSCVTRRLASGSCRLCPRALA